MASSPTSSSELSTILASSGLIEVVPGLMIWTLIAFAITFFVLKKVAFKPIQKKGFGLTP